ncbi:hypothetical protein TNCV_2553691 [Trichonephila clavipes]|nr:hypothetical protein TNCV_2553691 [Trichonephila clavipes]
MSYRTQFSSLVSTRLNMDALWWRESNYKQVAPVVANGLPTACENPLAEPVCFTEAVQMKSNRFTGSIDLSGKFTTRLTSVLNGRLQGFVIQGM